MRPQYLFVRKDSTGKAVLGSLVYRSKRPSGRNWVNLSPCMNDCCAATFEADNFTLTVTDPATEENIITEAGLDGSQYVIVNPVDGTTINSLFTYTVDAQGNITATVVDDTEDATDYQSFVITNGSGDYQSVIATFTYDAA